MYRFGDNAGSYDLVIAAASHYWNASLGLSHSVLERQLLVDPLIELIDMITTLVRYSLCSEHVHVFMSCHLYIITFVHLSPSVLLCALYGYSNQTQWHHYLGSQTGRMTTDSCCPCLE